MKKEVSLTHEFVHFIPEKIEQGHIYISIEYATVAHKCCCGCGNEVFTPLSPTDWELIFDGQTISLDPSIGNWSFPCQSHYWIRRDKVKWARKWSKEEIAKGRSQDYFSKQIYFNESKSTESSLGPSNKTSHKNKLSFWNKFKEKS